MDPYSSAGRVAMGLKGNRLDTVAQVPGSSWASDPSHQGRNQRSEVVLLVGKTGVRLERVAWEMVPRVLAVPAASGGGGPDCAAGQTGVYVGRCWGATEGRR